MNQEFQEYYQQNQKIQSHYSKLAQNYDELWNYTPEFMVLPNLKCKTN